MRRSLFSSWLIALLGLAVVGAQPCGVAGPAARSFAAGALVIPMDNCYQKRDTTPPPPGSIACNATADDGVFRAYGLVYFLLKNNVTVYWAVDGATPKASPTQVDVTVPAPASGAVAQRMSWTDGSFADLPTGSSGISYLGGPFLVDAADADRVVAMLTKASDPAHADFARFQAEATAATPNTIDIHRVRSAFDAKQVRPLNGPPPKLAILNITPPSGGKTSSNVMYQYAVAAGLSWPCTDTGGDCAGGLGAGCSKSDVLAYLASPGGDTAIPRTCTGNLCAPNFNQGPGLIYDILCDSDFIPPGAGKTYADTQLAAGNYKLLWIPHWDTSGKTPTGATDPNASVPLTNMTSADKLAWQLRTISSFVDAGNNLFVECLGIQALEGIAAEDNVNGKPVGIPATRFQSPSGMLKWNGSGTLQSLLVPSHPNVQIGDFAYSVVSGAITTYYPDGSKAPADAYLTGTQRLIAETPSTTPPPSWDVSSTIQVTGHDGNPRGNVAYLGGHDYSPKVGNAPGATGQTAGTRIVLNTLLNLGFGCSVPDSSDPASQCNTGLLGVCAKGHLQCVGGSPQCVPDPSAKPSAEICDGLDNDCNGLVDEGGVCNPPTCTPGATRSCYDGPAGTDGKGACHAGTQTCNGGAWSVCVGQVLPSPEVCNGKDDDCSGQVDDGNLCGSGSACTGGVCVPSSCNGETVRCPTGFACVASVCQAVLCGSATCGTGRICQSGQCVDPCAGITCGKGAACSGGQCMAGGCALTGCAAGQACLSGSCVADPCAGVACGAGTFCRLGDCVRSCSFVDCAPGQACDRDGFCVATCSPSCAAGEVCDAGTCRPDPCAGVSCGASQECQAGACVDAACSHVVCPQGQSCSAGQCLAAGAHPLQGGGSPGGGANTALVASAPAGGGCGSGPGGLASLVLLVAVALWRGLRRPGEVPAWALVAVPVRAHRPARRGVSWYGSLVLLAALAALATACGGKASSGIGGTGSDGGSSGTDGGVTATCSGSRTDLSQDLQNCGACGHACAAGYGCVVGSCLFPTGNPYLAAIDPPSAGVGSQLALRVTGEGFQAGATFRVTGAGFSREVPLTVDTPSSGRVPALDLSGVAAGTAEARVVNPGHLISNARGLALVDQLLLRGVTPAGVRQDQAGTVDLVLIGTGFVQGAQAQLTAGGASQPLPTTWVSAGEVHATGIAPATLAIGQYDLTVTNPGGAPSSVLKFTVMEGAPTLTSVTPACIALGQISSGSVTGSHFYPSSVVRVTGNAIQDSPLTTACLQGTDALGACANGKLQVSLPLTGIAFGTYTVTVWNPGSPAPLISSSQTVQVQASCP